MLAGQKIYRMLAPVSSRLKHSLPDLPYDYAALEPVISREIMSLHHTKHHAAYVNNLNALEEKLAAAVEQHDVQTVIALQSGLKFNGGGHINHSIFWQNLSPDSSKPSEQLCKQINQDFGSMDNLKTKLSAAAVGVQGSGWAWLGYDKANQRLALAACANQDPLQPTTGLTPIIGIDVWEHAYYLQYKNLRADYVKALFDILNWNDLNSRFKQASC